MKKKLKIIVEKLPTLKTFNYSWSDFYKGKTVKKNLWFASLIKLTLFDIKSENIGSNHKNFRNWRVTSVSLLNCKFSK